MTGGAIERTAPADSFELRAALYAGRIFLLPACAASRSLVERGRALLEAQMGPEPRGRQFELTPSEWLAQLGRVRERLREDPAAAAGARAVLTAIGLEPDAFALDAVRMRGVAHEGHLIPAAAPAYFAHRDTWYANPQSQINVWLPLFDVREAETFVFYGERFARPVENDSASFDHDEWVAQVGWQNPSRPATATYPAAREELASEPRLAFAAEAGEVLLFSAAHLHQTRPNASGATRFSLDFRVVHLGDHAAGRGAPNVDNRSRGSSLSTYRSASRSQGS